MFDHACFEKENLSIFAILSSLKLSLFLQNKNDTIESDKTTSIYNVSTRVLSKKYFFYVYILWLILQIWIHLCSAKL